MQVINREHLFDKGKDICKKNWLIIAILLLAACTRLAALDRFPGGMLPDEAYGAYNAWGLMTEGLDSRGYRYPVYFIAWGSGMNVLYSYLTIPMFRLLGVNLFAYRLPQAVVGIFSVYGMYRLGKEVFDERMGIFLGFIFAINPWHIMNVRFGLESNMAPGMFLLGLMFLVLGIKKKGSYFIWAAVFLGAALYCYALTWIMIPLFLLMCLGLFWKKIPRTWHIVAFIILLFFIALPLILFVFINLGVMEEIRTSFFSIPKLVAFRGEELDIAHLGSSFKNLGKLVLSQYGGENHMASELVGAYYFFTTPFMVAGVIWHVISLCRNYKKGDNDLQYVFLAWFVSAVLMCVLNENINMTHLNMLHIAVIFYGAFGVIKTADYLKNKWMLPVCLIFWCISFGLFIQDYIKTQSDSIYFLGKKTDEVLERAKELAGEEKIITIFDSTIIKYSYLLWYDKPDVSDFYQNAVYEGSAAWEELRSYGSYRYVWDMEDITVDGVYIIYYNRAEYFENLGFEVEKVNDLYYIAVG